MVNSIINIVQNKNIDLRLRARAGLVGSSQTINKVQENNNLLNDIFSSICFDNQLDKSKENVQVASLMQHKSGSSLDLSSGESKLQYLKDAYIPGNSKVHTDKLDKVNSEGNTVYKL